MAAIPCHSEMSWEWCYVSEFVPCQSETCGFDETQPEWDLIYGSYFSYLDTVRVEAVDTREYSNSEDSSEVLDILRKLQDKMKTVERKLDGLDNEIKLVSGRVNFKAKSLNLSVFSQVM